MARYGVNFAFTFTSVILITKPYMRAMESQKCIEYMLVDIFLEIGNKFIHFLN